MFNHLTLVELQISKLYLIKTKQSHNYNLTFVYVFAFWLLVILHQTSPELLQVHFSVEKTLLFSIVLVFFSF